MQRDFMEEWDAFCVQDWITFRTSLYVLSDFVQKWNPKVKGQKNVVCLHIRDELDATKKAQTGLKFCKGDVPFNEVHWSQLFRQLGTCGHPRGRPPHSPRPRSRSRPLRARSRGCSAHSRGALSLIAV